MKKQHIAAVIAVLFTVTGCTQSTAAEDHTRESISSAGKEALSVTAETGKKLIRESEISEYPSDDIRIEKDLCSADQKEPEDQSGDEVQLSPSGTHTPDPSPDPKPQPIPTPDSQTAPEATPEPDPVPAPVPKPDPTPTPTPEPQKPCPQGKNPDLGCEVILDNNYYREKFSSYSEAMARGQYYMDEVMYIGDIEITNYSVQEVYRNDHSIAFYGLNLWSGGSLIQ